MKNTATMIDKYPAAKAIYETIRTNLEARAK